MRARLLALALAAAGCGSPKVVTTPAAPVIQTTGGKAKAAPGQLRETVELALLLNRAKAAIEQEQFWITRDITVPCPEELIAGSAALTKKSEDLDRELNKKYGYARPGLAGLDNDAAALFDDLKLATKRTVVRELEAAAAAGEREGAKTPEEWKKRALAARDRIAQEMKVLEGPLRARAR